MIFTKIFKKAYIMGDYSQLDNLSSYIKVQIFHFQSILLRSQLNMWLYRQTKTEGPVGRRRTLGMWTFLWDTRPQRSYDYGSPFLHWIEWITKGVYLKFWNGNFFNLLFSKTKKQEHYKILKFHKICFKNSF